MREENSIKIFIATMLLLFAPFIFFLFKDKLSSVGGLFWEAKRHVKYLA